MSDGKEDLRRTPEEFAEFVEMLMERKGLSKEDATFLAEQHDKSDAVSSDIAVMLLGKEDMLFSTAMMAIVKVVLGSVAGSLVAGSEESTIEEGDEIIADLAESLIVAWQEEGEVRLADAMVKMGRTSGNPVRTEDGSPAKGETIH